MSSALKPGLTLLVSALLFSASSYAALALDRTRIIMDADNPSVSLTVTNENQRQPYLAQGWVENERGEKITSPLMVLPPVQRIEPGEKSQVKIQPVTGANLLSQDRETLFYFNLREIPPRPDQPNTLQVALQTRIKLFYRPAALRVTNGAYANPVQQQITLTRVGDSYRLNNPTGYYVTIIEANRAAGEGPVPGFAPQMVAPKQSIMLNGTISTLGSAPILQYVNDFGGRTLLAFHCQGQTCTAQVRQ